MGNEYMMTYRDWSAAVDRASGDWNDGDDWIEEEDDDSDLDDDSELDEED